MYNLNHTEGYHSVLSSTEVYYKAALIAPRAASRFISAALPLPRKYMYTCCT